MGDIAAVVFDWYGTLAAPSTDDFWDRLPEIIAAAGGVPVAELVAEWEALPLEHVVYSASEAVYRSWQRQRLEALLKVCGVQEPVLSRVCSEIEGTRYSRQFEVFPDVPVALAELRARGLVVGLCSNWDWDLERHLVDNQILALFDFILTSAALGYRKPHPAVFERILERANVAPSSVVFVGDNWHDDISGAAGAGFVPVHISRFGACQEADHADIACVRDLSQLADVAPV